MSFRGGDWFTTELFNRLASRLTATQILPYLNEALGVISAAGSFPWDQYAEEKPTAAAQFTPANTMDVGKKITAINVATGTPIVKVPPEEYVLGAAGYVDQTGTEYNGFSLHYIAGTSAYLQFYPQSLLVATVRVYYHQLPVTLTTGAAPTVRWDVPFMDSILLDMAEAGCKRVLSWAGWQDREASARAKLQDAVRIYSTDRINTGTAQETSNAVQEKTQLGRA